MTHMQPNDSYSNYLKSLRAVARGLWLGLYDYEQAWDALEVAIRTNITKAWYDGLAEAGIQPSEMSNEERLALQQMIVREQSYMNGFISHCLDNTKASGAAWAVCDAKAIAWANRARDARGKALSMAQSDPKLMWRLGHTEKHCGTCTKLHGKVKRASYWNKIGVRPQNYPNHLLECGGWKCGCSLDPTEEPLSKGTLGRLP